jgi:hypothetical protein
MLTYKRFPYIFAAVCSILYFAPFLRVLTQIAGDEGTLIMGAVRVVEGQVPFRDFFEAMGPGTFYWLGLFFKLLGTSWLATRIDLLVTTLGITLVLLYLARRLPGGHELAPLILFVAASHHSWNAISHHMDSNLFGLLSFAVFVFWMDKPRTLTIFLAGVGAALTTWFLLPKGLLLFLSFGLLLVIFYRKNPVFRPALVALLGGFLLVNAVALAWFWAAGGLPSLIYANLIWPFTHYSASNVVPYGFMFQFYWSGFMASLTPVLFPVMADVVSAALSLPFVVVMGLPLLLLGCVMYFRKSAFDRTTLPYWIAGCAFWLSELHRKDMAHIVWGSPLLILLAFSYGRQLPGKWIKPALQVVTVCAVLVASLNPMAALLANHKLVTRRGTIYAPFAQDRVLEYLNTHVAPGESVFVYPYAPMYYFLSATSNPTRYSILLYHTNTDQQFKEAARTLETAKVKYIVSDRTFPTWVRTWFPSFRMPPRDDLIIEPYLQDHYRVVSGADDRYELLERKEPVPISADAGGVKLQ